jgi:hypothetical protein
MAPGRIDYVPESRSRTDLNCVATLLDNDLAISCIACLILGKTRKEVVSGSRFAICDVGFCLPIVA